MFDNMCPTTDSMDLHDYVYIIRMCFQELFRKYRHKGYNGYGDLIYEVEFSREELYKRIINYARDGMQWEGAKIDRHLKVICDKEARYFTSCNWTLFSCDKDYYHFKMTLRDETVIRSK